MSWLGLLMIACGGSTPRAESASEPASTEPAVEQVNEPSSQDAATSSTAAGQAASEDDVNAVLQLVLDDPELDGHLHLGEPGGSH